MKLDAYTYDKKLIELQPLEIKNKPPQWWSNLKKVYKVFDPRTSISVPSPTIKACPGVVNYIRKPIIMKLWSDAIFKVFPDGRVKVATPLHNDRVNLQIGVHEKKQFGNLYENSTVVKLVSPWVMKASDRTDFMCTEVHYDNELRKHGILVAPGVINFYDQHASNVFLVFPVKEEEYEIQLSYGTPLMSIYPMTDKKVDIEMHHATTDEMNDIIDCFPSTFLGRYYSRKHTRR